MRILSVTFPIILTTLVLDVTVLVPLCQATLNNVAANAENLGDTESENASRVIQDFVFLCHKIDGRCIFSMYIIKVNMCHFEY